MMMRPMNSVDTDTMLGKTTSPAERSAEGMMLESQPKMLRLAPPMIRLAMMMGCAASEAPYSLNHSGISARYKSVVAVTRKRPA